MIVRLLMSAVLAFAPAAQAQVVSGRAVVAPVLGVGLAPVNAPQITVPSLTTLTPASLAPGLTLPQLLPAPSAVVATPLAAVPVALPQAAVARSAVPRALTLARPAPEMPDDGPIRRRFLELKAAFDAKKTEAVPAAESETVVPLAQTELKPESAPEEPPKPPVEPKGKRLFGFSRPLGFFLIALIVAQVGIEAQTAGLPPLIAKVFGNVSVAADMGMAAYAADVVGTILAPITAKKLGLKKGYIWSTAARVLTGGLIAGLLATNMIGLTAFAALLAVDNIFYGISYTLEKSIPAVMVDQDQAKLEKFKAVRQTAIESVATVIPIAAGALIAAAGFLPALLAFPVAMALAMTVVSITLKLPAKIAGANAAPLPGPQDGSTKAYFLHLGKGTALVVKTPALLFSLLAYAFVYAPTPIVYWLVAPAYGLHMAASAAGAAAYAGMMTGLYSLGSIGGALFMMRQQRKERDAAKMRGSMLRWSLTTALALTLFAALAWPATIWGTLTVPALALLVFGVPQVVAKLKLESYFQSQAPKGAVDDATAVMEGAASVFIVAGLWWFGKMLAGGHVTSLFWLAAATVPVIVPLLVLTWALARASKPPEKK